MFLQSIGFLGLLVLIEFYAYKFKTREAKLKDEEDILLFNSADLIQEQFLMDDAKDQIPHILVDGVYKQYV